MGGVRLRPGLSGFEALGVVGATCVPGSNRAKNYPSCSISAKKIAFANDLERLLE